jgi:hypothetical protein
MSSKEVYVSPKAEAMYPFVTKPSTKFDPDGTYKITLILDPKSEEHLGLLRCLKAHLEDAQKELKIEKAKNLPWRRHLRTEDKSDTGKFEVTFKSQFPPRVFDAVGNKVTGDLNVGNGSVVKVAYKWAPYAGFGGGVALYFQAIQIIELVEYAGGEASDYGFEPEQNGFNVEDKFAAAAGAGEPAPSDAQAASQTPDDEIPF